MKKFLILLLIAFIFPFSYLPQPVFSQATPTPIDYQLPYPGILPDHPLYPLKKLRDWLLLNLTRSPVKKTQLHLLISDKKLNMASALLESRRSQLAVDTILEGEQNLFKAASSLAQLSENNSLPEGLADKIELSAKKHQEVISQIYFNTADNLLKEKLDSALNLNQQANSQIQAVKQ